MWYKNCIAVRYISLQPDDHCKRIPVSIFNVYYFDDNGYWDTNFNWGFAKTMTSVLFIDVETTLEDWADYYSGPLWKVYNSWNSEWAYHNSVDNLLAMVVSQKRVAGKGAKEPLYARVVADPTALMNSDFQDIFAINYDGDYDNSFALTYNNYGNSFYLSAAKSYWDSKLPHFTHALNHQC
jgi:hypothetical protein